MRSEVLPAANYWTDDVKSAACCRLLNVDRENLGMRLSYVWWEEKQRAKWRNSFKNGEIVWMNNKAIVEFGFRRISRILQISEGVIHLALQPLWITPSLICRILNILRKPNSIITKCYHIIFVFLCASCSSSHKILDVGSGFGGPARHLAHTTNCSVTALELQEDIHKEGENLTKRCNLQDRLTHIAGDFLKLDLGEFIRACWIVVRLT